MANRIQDRQGMPLVLIETPYAGDVTLNVKFARACMRDSLNRGEAPFAMHLLYTQEGILNDEIPEERNWGIEAGFAWGKYAAISAVYTNLGITPGMKFGIQKAKEAGRRVVYRELEN